MIRLCRKDWRETFMDIKYKIMDKYKIEEDIFVSDGRLYIPAAGGVEYKQILCSSLNVDYILDVERKEGSNKKKYFMVDFEPISNEVELLIGQLLETKEKCISFNVSFLDGLQSFGVQDIRRDGILVHEILSFKREGHEFSLGVFFYSYGNMYLIFSKKEDLYCKNVNINLMMAKQDSNMCSITCISRSMAILEQAGGECVRFELEEKMGGKKYDIPIKKHEAIIEDEKEKVELCADIDLSKIENLFSTHWNIALVFKVNGEEYSNFVFLKAGNKKLENEIQKASLENAYKNPNGKNLAYLNITRSKRVRIYTGDLNNAAEYEISDFEQLIRNTEVPFGRDIHAQLLEAGMGFMKFKLMEASFDEVEEASFLVYKLATLDILIVPIEIIDRAEGIFNVGTESFSEICKQGMSETFKFAIALKTGNRFIKGRLFDKSVYTDTMIGRYGTMEEEMAQEDEDRKNGQGEISIYFDNIFSMKAGDENMEACPYVGVMGYFMMRMCGKESMSIYKIVCEAEKVSVNGKYLKVRAKCPGNAGEWVGFLLSYNYQKEEDREERFFEAVSIEKQGDYTVLSGKIPLAGQEFKGIYWFIRPVFKEDGKMYSASLKALTQEEKESFKKFYRRNGKYYDVGEEKYILFPFVGSNDNVNLMYRKTEGNDGLKFRIKERMGLHLFELFEKKLKAQKIMLIYEKYCYMAQDNGYQLFKYCMENDMEKFLNRKIYYVIDKKSPDYEKVKKYHKNVLDFMSVKFIAYLRASKLLVGSDVRSHAYAFRHRSSIIAHIIPKKKHVFLQHGVTALKKVDNIFGKRNNTPTNLFIVTSDDEYNIVSKYFGYNKNEIALTGFARWDVLEDKSHGKREILLMPTWRNWLDNVDRETFKESAYYKNYMKLLNSDRLHKILEDNDVHLNFYIHPKFKDYIGDFNACGNRISLIPFGTEPLNELMMQCSLLITDYSSVSWDVYYMKKPVLFYQFDIESYNKTHGSYIDMEHDLFGDRTLELDELIELIEENIKGGFKLKPRYEEEFHRHFKYVDKDNCKRICMAIKQKGY